jgi:hypothetical protein
MNNLSLVRGKTMSMTQKKQIPEIERLASELAMKGSENRQNYSQTKTAYKISKFFAVAMKYAFFEWHTMF